MATRAEAAEVGSGKLYRRTRVDLATVVPFAAFLITYALLPRFVEPKEYALLIYIGINALVALGLNLLMGYAGQISLGHAAFFGLGAYTSAILTTRPIPAPVIPGFAVGVGVMTGWAVLMSLTRASGWKLVAGIGSLVVLSWAAGIMRLGLPAAIIVYGAGMAGLGIAAKVGWKKAAAAGIVAALMTHVCRAFLVGVLAKGGVSPWTGMAVGIFFTGLIAYLIGAQVLRLKGHYLAMATLGFGIIVEIIFRQWTAVTGGSSDGIYGIPTMECLSRLPRSLQRLFELAAGGPLSPREQYYYLVWGFVFIALVLAVNIVRSRVGRAFRAVHGSEVAAESLGVDTERYKVQVFVLSAALGSVAGSLHAHNVGIGYVNPSEFSFIVSVQLLVMVVVGGMASVWGALFGAAFIQLLKNWILNFGKAQPHLFGLALKGLDPIVFGAILIAMMMVLPQGLVRGFTDAVSIGVRAVSRARKQKAE